MGFFDSLFSRPRSGGLVPPAEAGKLVGPEVDCFSTKGAGEPQILTSKDLADLLAVGASAAGVGVNPATAMQFSTVWACVRLLAEVLATVPIHVYLKRPDGGKQRVTDTGVADLLSLAPNSWQTVFEYIDFLTTSLCLRGNSYAYVSRLPNGSVVELVPLPPTSVTPKRTGYEISYQVRFEGGKIDTLPADRIHHVRGMSLDGYTGVSPITYHRNTIGLAMAAENHGGYLFKNGAMPAGALVHPGQLSDEAYARIRKSWAETHGGDRQGGVAVLEEGLKFENITMSNEDAQYLECVAPETRMSMADGTVKMAKDIRVGDVVMAWDDGLVAATVSAVGVPPVKRMVKILTARGREITTTFDHPFLAKRRMRTAGGRRDESDPKWIHAGVLRKGNYIKVALGNVAELGTGGLDFDQAYLLGALVGNGYIRSGSCSWSSGNAAVVERVDSILRARGGQLKRKDREYDYEIITGGSGCKGSWFRDLVNVSGLVGLHAATKMVPEIVMQSGIDAWVGFLSGYVDTDGHVNGVGRKGQPVVHLHSVSLELLKGSQHLFALLGINTSCYFVSSGGKKRVAGVECDTQDMYALYISGRCNLRAVAGILRLAHSENGKKLAEYAAMPPSNYRDILWQYDVVKQVVDLGEGRSIGIEVSGVHTHITEGLVSHNTRQFQRTEICSLYRVPPHMIGDLTKSSFSNITQQSLEMVKYTFLPLARRFELAMRRDLLSEKERARGMYIEFLFDGLERADIETRFKVYNTGIMSGIYSPNECRSRENQNPREGGDIYLTPLNMSGTGNEPVPAKQAKANAAAAPCACGLEHKAIDPDEYTGDQGDNMEFSEEVAGLNAIIDTLRPKLFTAAERIVASECRQIESLIEQTYHAKGLSLDFLATIETILARVDKEARRGFEPLLRDSANLLAVEAARMAGGNAPKLTEDLADHIARYLDIYIEQHTGSTLRQLQALLQATPEEQAADTLLRRINEWRQTRAGKIADEEAIRFANVTARQTWLKAGVTKFRWVAQGSKTCPFCRKLNGRIVGAEEAFLGDGEVLRANDGKHWASMKMSGAKKHPPIHRGCVCAIVPELASFDRVETPDAFISKRNDLPDSLRPFLTQYSAKEYNEAGAQLYLSETGHAGFAIKEDGELVSVFSLPGLKEGNNAAYEAMKNGARYLWCFDTGLVDFYQRQGFRVVEALDWNDEYAPEGWNYKQFGKPKVKKMVLGKDDTVASGVAGKATGGHRKGNLWIEEDGTVKTLMAKMGEMGTPVPLDTPRGEGSTPAFQDLANRYLKECFDFEPDE